MCGRFTQTATPETIVKHFELPDIPLFAKPNYIIRSLWFGCGPGSPKQISTHGMVFGRAVLAPRLADRVADNIDSRALRQIGGGTNLIHLRF